MIPSVWHKVWKAVQGFLIGCGCIKGTFVIPQQRMFRADRCVIQSG